MVGGGGQGKEKSSSSEVVGLMKNRGLVIFAERLKEEIFELPLKRLERRTLHLVLEGRGRKGRGSKERDINQGIYNLSIK